LTAVTNELGYPSPKMLARWYKEYLEEKVTGVIHDHHRRLSRYIMLSPSDRTTTETE